MKKIPLVEALLLLFLACSMGVLSGQNGMEEFAAKEQRTTITGVPSTIKMKGGNFDRQSACLSPEERQVIQEEMLLALDKYGRKDQLSTNEKTNEGGLAFPLRLLEGTDYFHGFAVSNFVDHDDSAGLRDYSCSDNTYDGHNGTDLFPFPFPWYLYANDFAEVVAAADGIIINKQDGNPDTNCELVGNWNAVYLEHDDGTIGWYGHMKTNSLTSKAVGESVAQGEYLGVVASSGMSTDAHLHLELYDANQDLIDPFQGTCNMLDGNSVWCDQLPYSDTKLNAILSHSSEPVLACGPDNERDYLKNDFSLNDSVFVGLYYTDWEPGGILDLKIIDPAGAFFESLSFTVNSGPFEWYYWTLGYQFTDAQLPGTWTAEVVFGGQTYTHEFTYNMEPSGIAETLENSLQLYPIPASQRLSIAGLEINNFQNLHEFEIINSSGQVLKTGNLSEPFLMIDELPEGLYFLKIKQGERVWIESFVKSR